MIKKSSGPAEAKQKLINGYSLSERQSQAILDLKLQRLTGLERDKIINDYNEVLALLRNFKVFLMTLKK